MENVVYVELRIRGCSVQVGSWKSKEVDFVVKYKNGGMEYIRVCLGFTDDSVRERELAPLRAIGDSNKKTVIVMNGIGGTMPDGIAIINDKAAEKSRLNYTVLFHK